MSASDSIRSESWEKPRAALAKSASSGKPFLVGGLVVVGVVLALIVSGMAAGGRFFITVDEVVNDPEFVGQSVRVAGAVLGETIEYDAENLVIEFTIVNIPDGYSDLATALNDAVNNPGATRMNVRVENAVKPELLQHEAQAIMTGTLNENGVFMATELNLKCPTRFTEAGPAHEGVAPDAAMPADHLTDGIAPVNAPSLNGTGA
jgi:cytochrome c-type biogenesis protein CcmE